MKTTNFLLAAFLVVITFTSCKKEDHNQHNSDPAPKLSIDYPAAYIVNGGSNSVSVVKLADNTVAATISLSGGTFPHHIYLSPDKKNMAIAMTNTDLSGGHGGHGGGASANYKVLIIDAVTGEIHHEISLEALPHNAVYNTDGTELWIPQAHEDKGEVLVYNTADYLLKNTVMVGMKPSEVTFSNNGSKVFVANTEDSTVSVINPSTKAVTATIKTGADPVGAWPGMNGHMYVDNETDKTVTEIRVSDLEIMDTINLGFKPGYVAFFHHTDELWVTDATNGKVVYYTNIAGNWTKAGEISTGADAHAIAFDADGTVAYVSNQGAGNVSVINPMTHQVVTNITVGSKPNGIIIKQ